MRVISKDFGLCNETTQLEMYASLPSHCKVSLTRDHVVNCLYSLYEIIF